MVGAHRQAWAWQDEWFDMTMEDVREMERQTQLLLAKKMAALTAGTEEGADEEAVPDTAGTSPGTTSVPATGTPKESQPNRASSSATTSWPISCISESSSDDDEFFDCQGISRFQFLKTSSTKFPR